MERALLDSENRAVPGSRLARGGDLNDRVRAVIAWCREESRLQGEGS